MGRAHTRLAIQLVRTIAILLLIAPAVAAEPLVARPAPVKPAATVLRRSDAADRIVVKFREGTGARRRADGVRGAGIDTAAVAAILGRDGMHTNALERLFTRPEDDLDRERLAAQRRSGRALADLNLYYRVQVPAGVDPAALCDGFNSLPFVELATPMPRPAPLPRDILPPTADFSDLQEYRDPPPHGIGATSVAALPGADGNGVALIDLEYSWVLAHEDLDLGDISIDRSTPVDPFPDEGNHGTAVLGELVAPANGYGVTGLVPAAIIRIAPTNTLEFGFDVGRAVSLATSVLLEGDVILIEQQICICDRDCNFETHEGLGPVEDFQPWYDAIATATASGITVVEAGGNGGMTLDDPACANRYNRAFRDSGAIVVGAGTPDTRVRVPSSSWGSRIDLQGWGAAVTTTGYGDLFDPADVLQRYTDTFGGTSGASPIVASAAVIVQSVRRAHGLGPLSPAAVRALLVDTGTPEGDPAHRIGPLPNLPAALAGFLVPTATLTPRRTATATRTRTPTPTRTATPNSVQRSIAEVIRAIFRGGAFDLNADGRVTAADVTCVVRGESCGASP